MSETIKQALSGKNFMRNILAIIGIALGFCLIFCLLFLTMEPAKRDMANLCLGFDFGMMTMIWQYYFGTSQSSTEKTEMINKP